MIGTGEMMLERWHQVLGPLGEVTPAGVGAAPWAGTS